MSVKVPESLSNAFVAAAKVSAKAGILALRGTALVGGAVIAGSGAFALTQTFMNHATDTAAYAFPLVTMPFGAALATVGAVPKKVLNFMDRMF